MDEQQVPQEALNEPVEADVTESPTVEPTEAQPVEESQPIEQDDSKPKRGAESRIRELVSEKKQLEAERNQYAELLQQSQQMPIPENLSEEQYRALATDANYATLKVQELERKMAQKDFSTEVDLVEQTYPELNPKSDKYDEKLAESMAKAYESGFVVKDRNGNFAGTKMSLKEFTDMMIQPYREALVKGAAQTSEALSQQASEAVVTPESSQTSEPKAFEDLSIKEMEAKLGVVRH